MTEEQTQDFLKTVAAAIGEGVRTGVSSSVTVRHSRPSHNPLTVAALVVALLAPIGGLVGWSMSLSGRVAVLEAQQTQLRDAAAQLSALKQELTDFRQEFSDWRRSSGRNPATPIQ